MQSIGVSQLWRCIPSNLYLSYFPLRCVVLWVIGLWASSHPIFLLLKRLSTSFTLTCKLCESDQAEVAHIQRHKRQGAYMVGELRLAGARKVYW